MNAKKRNSGPVNPEPQKTNVVVSSSNQHYQIIFNNASQAHPSAKKVDSHCNEGVERLVRNEFSFSDSYWRSNLIEHFPDEPIDMRDSNGLFKTAAKLISKNRIQIYILPSLTKSMVARDGKGKAFRFIKGPDPIPSGKAKPIDIINEAKADEILGRAMAEDGFWKAVLSENGSYPSGKHIPAGGHKALVREKLISGELRTYEMDYTAATPKVSESSSESAANEPGAKAVPLAPETPLGWIEIKLMYEDDEPIANESYWIKDCDGKEYTGKTDDKGIARLDGVPQGYCDIKFPELDGWYQ